MEARRFCFLYNFCHHAGQRARRIPVYLHRRRAARACSSTIPISTFAKKHCSKSCSRRSSWRTTMASRSTRTTCARAPYWKTRSCCARWLQRSTVFLFINVLRHFTAQRAVSQIPKGFILLKKGLCKMQSPFSLSKKSAINADFFDRLKFVLFPIRFAKAFWKLFLSKNFLPLKHTCPVGHEDTLISFLPKMMNCDCRQCTAVSMCEICDFLARQHLRPLNNFEKLATHRWCWFWESDYWLIIVSYSSAY